MEADSLQDHELGPDGDLVASMISTAVMPMLCKLMADGGVDPYSSKHVKRAVDLAEQIGLSVDRKEAKFQVSEFEFSEKRPHDEMTSLQGVCESFSSTIPEGN